MGPGEVAMRKEITFKPRTLVSQVDRELEKMEAEKRAREAEKNGEMEPPRNASGVVKGLPAKVFKCGICGHEEDAPVKLFHHRRKEHPGTTGKNRAEPEDRPKAEKEPKSEKKAMNLDEKAEKKRAYMKEYHRRKKAGEPALERKAKKIKVKVKRKYHRVAKNTDGLRLPAPISFCVNCGTKLPVMERDGKALPAAFRFCGHCGFELPTIGGV